MSRVGRDNRNLADLDELIEEITVDAYGDDEKLWAFRQAFADSGTLPADGFVIGEPVSVIEIDYDGNERRGLTARCRREDGSEHAVAAADVVLPQSSRGARHVAAYRKWLGLEPYPSQTPGPARRRRQHKATAEDVDLPGSIELIVLSVTERAARCRLLVFWSTTSGRGRHGKRTDENSEAGEEQDGCEGLEGHSTLGVAGWCREDVSRHSSG
jgi:hypothetical protein